MGSQLLGAIRSIQCENMGWVCLESNIQCYSAGNLKTL